MITGARGETVRLPDDLERAVKQTVADWRERGLVDRLWRDDPGLWTGHDEARWLGWLRVTARQLADLEPLLELQRQVKAEGFADAMLLGMGGSSLGPEVLRATFGVTRGFPDLHVLDSTDPGQIRSFTERVDLADTLFIVSSKSGTTLEPNILMDHFYEKVKDAVGADEVGRRFVAVTDPGSPLEEKAREHGFRAVFHGVPSIGGRYSVMSDFGMVPAAVMGLDLARFLERTQAMVEACAPAGGADPNPGLLLGATLGELGNRGRDKVTVIASPGIADLGAWLEQLLAESTGKEGRGLIPVDGERPGAGDVYGDDRLFAYVRLADEPDGEQDRAVDALEVAGQPVFRIDVGDRGDLGAEFFRWELATAVAGSILGINPFDQPNVEASKKAARRLTDAYEEKGALPSLAPLATGEGLELYGDADGGLPAGASVAELLRVHLGRIGPGDYFAVLAYLERSVDHDRRLQEIRHAVRDACRVATCLGYGPRFQHSTGQAYKGGPNSGVFLQLTADPGKDLAVPGRSYSFSVVEAAQARGDFEAMTERERRILRVHLGRDVGAGLDTVARLVREALTDREGK